MMLYIGYRHTVLASTPCVKNTCHFYFYADFGKRGPIFIFFSVLNSETICG